MALTPDYLQKCSDEIDRLFWKLGTKILADIADRIRHAGGMTSTAEYLNEKLRVFGLQQSMINELIAAALKTEQSEVDKLMEESTAKSTRQLFENLVAAGYDTTGLEFREQILKSTNVLNNELTNLTRTTAQLGSARMMDAFDQAYLQVSSGAYSFDEAVANACQKLAREGLGMVEYPSGARRSIEAAVRVAVRTSVNQNALQCEMDAIKKMGINLVQTSSHLGARPTHAVWQGKVFWLNTEDPRYENFYEATGYGTATGLGGYNCRHSFYPYFEELGEQTYEHFDEEKNREYYEQEQKQRYLERKVREWDRRVQILKAGGQNTAEASRWKKYYKDQLDDLVKNSNGFLKRDYSAEKALAVQRPQGKTTAGLSTTLTLAQHKTGNKVAITDQAITKVKTENPKSYTAEQSAFIVKTRKGLMKYAKENNNSNEVGCLIDIDNKKAAPFVSGDQSTVDVLKDAENFHMMTAAPDNSLELTHNHPGLSYFSLNDLRFFLIYQQVRTMSVVTNQGVTWYITKTDSYDRTKAFKLIAELALQYKEDELVEKFLKSAYSVGIERN